MRARKGLVVLLAVISVGLVGCASSQRGDVYTRAEARQPAIVKYGKIVSLRPVTIEGTKTPIGAGAGAVVGGIAGSGVGGGRGSAIASVIGAVAGGMLGGAAEEGITRAKGVEIVVREDDGVDRAYVQALNENERFNVGDRVRIMSTGANSRVERAQ